EENAIRTLLGQHIEAIVVVGVDQSAQARRLLERSRIPVVQTFELTGDPIDINVGLWQRQAGFEATRFLLDLGHKSVGFTGGQLDDRHKARHQGYVRAMNEAGLDHRDLTAQYPQQSSVTL